MSFFIKKNKPADTITAGHFFRREVIASIAAGKPYPPASVTAQYGKIFGSGLPKFCNSCFPEGSTDQLRTYLRKSNLAEQIISSADTIFGYHPKYLPEIFPDRFIWDIIPESLPEGADPVNYLDKARFHELYDLAFAGLLTGDEKYYLKYFEYIDSFIDGNKFCRGLNWHSTTETALRAVNVMLTLPLILHGRENFNEAGSVNTLLLQTLLYIQNIQGEARHSFRTLIVLLFKLLFGKLYAGDSLADDLYRDSAKTFEKEILKITNEDGTTSDPSSLSIWHTAETVPLFLLYAGKFGIVFQSRTTERVNEFYKSLAQISGNRGFLYSTGDQPVSRFFAFSFFNKDFNPGYLLESGSAVFGESTLKPSGNLTPAGIIPLLHPASLEHFAGLPAAGNIFKSIGFKDGGKYFLRNEEIEIYFLAHSSISENSVSAGHDDVLSFEILYSAKQFVVDPGVYSPSADKLVSAKLRSALFHNTFVIDNIPGAASAVSNRDLSKPKVTEWETDESKDSLVMLNHAYIKLADPVICKRGVYFEKSLRKLVIKDEFIGGARHKITSSLNLHPGVRITQLTETHFLLNNSDKKIEVIYSFPSNNGRVSAGDSYYSPQHSVLLNSSRLSLTIEDRMPTFYIMEILFK